MAKKLVKRLAPFRVPKGVPAAVRRALRLPKPGRFLSTVKALQLHDLLEVSARAARKEHTKIVRGLERARTTETRQKYLAKLRAAQRGAGAIEHGLEQLSRSSAREPLPPLAGRGVVPTIEAEEFSPTYALPGESALEWEIGVDYTEETAGRRHRHGRASDVSFNARLFDPAGDPVTEYQVREAMDNFTHGGDLAYRSGRGWVTLEARTVRWENWKGAVRHGDESDLDNFRAILQRVGDGGLRVGAVKREGL